MLKNLTVTWRISLGFAAILLLLVLVAAISFNGQHSAAVGFEEYRGLARDTNLVGRLQANMLMVRMNVKDFIITGSEEDRRQFDDYWQATQGFMDTAQQEIQNPTRAKLVDDADEMMAQYGPSFGEVVKLMNRRDELVNGVLNVNGPKMQRALTNLLDETSQRDETEASRQTAYALRALLLARLYVVKFLDTNVQADVDRVAAEFRDFHLRIEQVEQSSSAAKATLQEVRRLAEEYTRAFDGTVQAIAKRNAIIDEQLDVLGPQFAQAIEDVKLSVKEDQDTLGPKLQQANTTTQILTGAISFGAVVVGVLLAALITKSIVSALKQVIEGLSDGSEQTTSASGQVAASSQSLAEGASEQAASIEEITSSVEEISSMVKNSAGATQQVAEMSAQNTANAREANSLMTESAQLVDRGQQSMGRLSTAVDEIKGSSEQTAKIIKTIDEIAFQTNLLALNAAVEAARAGDAGKGFAVVAEEVRNLAARSAEAARNTASLIEQSLKNADNGVTVASETAEALTAITESSQKVATLIGEISAASEEQTRLVQEVSEASGEQAKGVEQISSSVAQMDKVTQANAATAEESASAAEELSSQAEELNRMVGDLQAMVTKKAREERHRRSKYAPTDPGEMKRPQITDSEFSGDADWRMETEESTVN